MKVLHIITTLGTGGAEKLLLDTLPLYNKKGIKADVLVLYGEDSPFLFRLKEMKCCTVFTMKSSSYYNPSIIFKLIPYLKRYDIVHAHLFSPLYFTALAKLFSTSKTTLIFTEHNTSNRRIEKRIYKLPEKFIYSFYKKIICITEEVNKVLINHLKLKADKSLVIENGVNISIFNNATPLPRQAITEQLKDDDFLVAQIAGFRKQKDQETLIKAVSLLPENVKLLLVGDGETRKKCEELSTKLSLSDRVFFLGISNNIPSLLKTVDMSVLSTHYEGFGLVAVEGMASGRPFVASDVPGLSDVVKDAGVFFPKGDEKALADEILKLMNDKEHYNQVVGKCLERASKYDIHKMVDKTIDLYKEVYSKK